MGHRLRDEKGINDSAALRWRGILKQAQKAQAVEAAAQGAEAAATRASSSSASSTISKRR